jgi:putative transposase
MQDYDSLNHTRWECKYHIVWIPKYRRKELYGTIRIYLGEEIRKLAREKECEIEEGHIMPDHIHILISIPPKYSVSQVIGYIKGKSAIYIARRFGERKKYFSGQNFWARGYYVSTVGRDEKKIRAYIQDQEKSDKQLDLITE